MNFGNILHKMSIIDVEGEREDESGKRRGCARRKGDFQRLYIDIETMGAELGSLATHSESLGTGSPTHRCA